MRFEQAALCLVLFGSTLPACKKDKDETAPVVRIIAPITGSTISIPDTFTVRVEVSDEHIVEALTIELVDQTGRSIASGIISVNSSSGSYATELRLSDERVLSGAYTIVARASDGENDGRGFLSVNILEAPLRLRSIFLAPPFSTASVNIIRVDSLGEPSTWTTVQDFNGIAVDNHWQHVVVAGSQFAPLQALPTSWNSSLWQIAPWANDQPGQFTAVTVDPTDRKIYFATRDGFIRGFTGEGVPQFTAECLPGYRCEHIVMMENGLATWQRAIVGGASRLVTYSVAGTVLEQLIMEPECVALFHRSGTSLIHFANTDGSGLVEDINISEGGTPEVRVFTGETIRYVVRLDASNFAVALTDRLVRFNYSTNSVTTISPGLTVDALAFDPAHGALLASQGTLLLTIDPNSGTVVNTTPTSTPIAHILPLLNR